MKLPFFELLSHYDWLKQNLLTFFRNLNVPGSEPGGWVNEGLISAHGDKCYSYKADWERNRIHFFHGVAIYLLARCNPYSKEVYEDGFAKQDVKDWVIENYPRFSSALPDLPAPMSDCKDCGGTGWYPDCPMCKANEGHPDCPNNHEFTCECRLNRNRQ